MWGSDEAVELQMLLLLDMLHVVEMPDDTRERVIIDSFIAFIHRKLPDAGCVGLAANLKQQGRGGEFVAMLREFREYVERRLAAKGGAVNRRDPLDV